MVQPDRHIVKYDLQALNSAYALDLLTSYARDMWTRAMAELTAKHQVNFTTKCELDHIQLIQQDLHGKQVRIMYFADTVLASLRRCYLAATMDVKFDEEQNGWFLNTVPFKTVDVDKWFKDFCNRIETTSSSAAHRRDVLEVERDVKYEILYDGPCRR